MLLINCLIAAAAAPDQQASSSSSLQPMLQQYSSICSSAAHPGSGASDEVLYGRAGTLLGALLLRQKLGAHAVPDAAVAALAQAILTSGTAFLGQQHEDRSTRLISGSAIVAQSAATASASAWAMR